MNKYILIMHDGQQLFWEGDVNELFFDTGDNISELRLDAPGTTFLHTPSGRRVSMRYVVGIEDAP